MDRREARPIVPREPAGQRCHGRVLHHCQVLELDGNSFRRPPRRPRTATPSILSRRRGDQVRRDRLACMRRILLFVVALTITACASRPAPPPVSTPFRPAPVSGFALPPKSGVQNDHDLDGAISADDRCPSDVETRNGYQDDDGCPDDVPRDLGSALKAYRYTATEAEDLRGRGVASPRLQAKLKIVADVMSKYPDVRLEMIVHSDREGEVKYSKTPTNQLGHAVVRYLAARKGIEGARLFSIGAGADMPLATNRSARGRFLNRRIEFALVVEY